MIRELPRDKQELLKKRYSSLSLHPEDIRFIDRMVADSRQVALNHTAGLSLSDTGFTISSSPLREIRVTHIFLQRKHFVYSFSQKNDLSLAN